MVSVYEALVLEETVENMTLWGEREVTGLPPAPAGSYPINIAFDYSIEQQLSVHVEVPGHGISERWVANHVENLEKDRVTSDAKLARLADKAEESLTQYADRVRAKLSQLPPAAIKLLEEMDSTLKNGDLIRAREVKAGLAEALFDADISLN